MPICGWASTAIKPREREETMDRQPIYHETRSQYRVISMPNGLWLAQTFRGRKDNKPDKTRDPWVALGHRPTTLQTALNQMGAAAMH
jgi:hypothetical protein